MEREAVRLRVAVFYVIFAAFFALYGSGNFYPSLQWTPQNPKFNSSSGHLKMKVLPTSQVTLICPNIVTVLVKMETDIHKDQLYENVWIVDKESFHSCHVNTSNSNNRLLLECDLPLSLKYFTMVFQRYSAVDDGLEFIPGRSYYFIATSDGSKASLKNTQKGHCDRGMKMEVYVCRYDEQDCELMSPAVAAEPTKATTVPNISIGGTKEESPSSTLALNINASLQPSLQPPDESRSVNVGALVQDNKSKLSTSYKLIGILAFLLGICLVIIFLLIYRIRRKAKRDCGEELEDNETQRPLAC